MPHILKHDEEIEITNDLTRDATWRVLDLSSYPLPSDASGVIIRGYKTTATTSADTHFGIRPIGSTLTGNLAYRMSESTSVINTGNYHHSPIVGGQVEYYAQLAASTENMVFHICGWWLDGEMLNTNMAALEPLYTIAPVDETWIPADLTGIPGYTSEYTAVVLRCVNNTGTSNRRVGWRPDSGWGEVSYNGYHHRYANDVVVPISNDHIEVKGSVISAFPMAVVGLVKGCVAFNPPPSVPDINDDYTWETVTVPGLPNDAVAAFTTVCAGVTGAEIGARSPSDTGSVYYVARSGYCPMYRPENGQVAHLAQYSGSSYSPLNVVGGYFLPASSGTPHPGIHEVQDLTYADDPKNIYFGQSVQVGDKFSYKESTETNGWGVSIDALGYPIIDPSGGSGTDSFLFNIDKGNGWEPEPPASYTWEFTIGVEGPIPPTYVPRVTYLRRPIAWDASSGWQGVDGGTWSASGLPAGYTINSTSGIVTGTATAAGATQTTVTVDGVSAAPFDWTVEEKPGGGGSGSRGVKILWPKVHTRDIKRRGWRTGRRGRR